MNPAAEGPLAVGDSPEPHLHRVHPDRVGQTGARPAEHEVDLHVHEARDEGEVGQVDHLVRARRALAARRSPP